MKKVTLYVPSETSFFSREHKLSALVDIALHFSTKTSIQISLYSIQFFLGSFVCIVEELTSLPVFSLSLTVGSKSYGFILSKLEQVPSESDQFKEVLLDDKLESFTVCTQLKFAIRFLLDLIVAKLNSFSLVHRHVLFHPWSTETCVSRNCFIFCTL